MSVLTRWLPGLGEVSQARVVNVIARTLRDLCLVGAGFCLFKEIPPSISLFGFTGLLGAVWATMLAGGGLVSFAGVVGGTFTRDRPRTRAWFEVCEIVGCSMVGAGFAIWAWAALHQPEQTWVTWAVALVFLSGVCGQVYRVEMIANGKVRR